MSTIPGPPGMSDAVQPLPSVTNFPTVDTITLANAQLPGKWTLIDAKRKYGWQIQKGFGLSGAFLFPTGDELVVAKFRGEFWSSSDFGLFKVIRKTLLDKACFTIGGTIASKALGIDHPELKALGVDSVVISEVTAFIDEGAGLWAGTIEFIQYRAPVPAPAKPSGAIPDLASPQPTAADNVEREEQALSAQAAALLGAL